MGRSELNNECVFCFGDWGRDVVACSRATTRRLKIQSHALEGARECRNDSVTFIPVSKDKRVFVRARLFDSGSG